MIKGKNHKIKKQIIIEEEERNIIMREVAAEITKIDTKIIEEIVKTVDIKIIESIIMNIDEVEKKSL